MNEVSALAPPLTPEAKTLLDRLVKLRAGEMHNRAAGNHVLADRCAVMRVDELEKLHGLEVGALLNEAVRLLALAVQPVEPRRQVARCPSCRGQVEGLLVACPKPECIPREIAEAVRLDRDIEASGS